MGSINKQVSRYEITAVFTHPDAKVDIVLVHGLNGTPKSTWTAENKVFWPTDLLPLSLRNVRANILVYGYNADVYSSRNDRSASDNFIYQHAQTLVTNLTLYRKSEGTSTNPILWVAHSLGGLLVKRSLLYSNDIKDSNFEDTRSIFISTFGIIFLGTPHTGSGTATWSLILQNMSDAIIPRRIFEGESILLGALRRDHETLQSINSNFLDVYQRFKIHMAHESHKTDVKGTKVIVVDATSASPQLPGVISYGIEATHSGMCKFDGINAPGYRNVSIAIREWVEEAPSVIHTRWEIESEARRARAHFESPERTREQNSQAQTFSSDLGTTSLYPILPSGTASTILSLSQSGMLQGSTSQRQPPFVHPERFRPNSFFKGREEELEDLHRMLVDKKRRLEGTSAVLIQGIPGAGKTHLARQYVFSHKEHYPGGIYWIRSTTLQDMENGFWQIAKAEAIREMIGQERNNDLSNPRKMVEIVRNWFNDFEGWLLVLDGIRFDSPDVGDFIPDSKNSSLIFTSTERAVAGSYLLDNPSVMELGMLPAQDAQELLLEEMGKKKPYTTDDLRRALELVQLMDRLPLMIHAAAQQMNATREPLAKYLKSFQDKPRVGMLPAYKKIRDQLQDRGDTSALNLIYILSFFSQLVPVEMLALGMKALDKRTPIKTEVNGQKRSLNRTFVILIKFALIERNEMDDIPSSSSRSSDISIDNTAEPLDILRIHSIVQAFFIELLAEEKQLLFWLERAIRVFCLSFDEADSRMKKDPSTGLPDDYRRYAIHGKRLIEHLDRYHRPKETSRGNVTELAAAREDLEARIMRLPREIDELQGAISTSIVDGREMRQHSSVFERTNSLSSQSTNTSNKANHPHRGLELEENYVQYESPLSYENPHHFHIPYPPESASQWSHVGDHPDDRTVTPYPPDTVVGSYSEVEEPGWTVVSKHRSVKKMEQRRYHDHGGAWRQTANGVNDPRVSISRESARGLMSLPRSSRGGRSPSRSRISARSDAELELLHIKQVSPPPPRGGGYIQDKGRSSSAGTATAIRPWPTLGKSSYADILSGTAIEDEMLASPTFSSPPSRAGTIDRKATYDALSVNSLRTIDTKAPSFWQRIRENQPATATSGMNETNANEALANQHDQEAQAVPPPSYVASLLQRLRRPASEPKRLETGDIGKTMSKRSKESLKSQSPVSQSAEFPPTTYPGVTRTANSSPGVQYSPFYPPGLQVVTNSKSSLRQELTEQQNASSQSGSGYCPSGSYDDVFSWSETNLRHPAVNILSPATTVPISPVFSRPPDGYTSQPMSRNPSSNPPVAGLTGSSGTARSSNSGYIRAGLSRPRAPSLVETEPSPQLQPFDMPQTSYQAWSLRNSRRRGDSLFGSSNMSAARWLPTAQIPNFEAPEGSPDLASYRTSPQISAAGDNMARSGSGGIRVGDGRIIAFGDVPVDIAEAGRRVHDDWNQLERRAIEAGNSSRVVRASGDGAESPPRTEAVGLGIMSG